MQQGYTVGRASDADGPWYVAFDPSGSRRIGEQFSVDLGATPFVGANLPGSGTLIDAGMFGLVVVANTTPPRAKITVGRDVWHFASPGYRTQVIADLDTFLQHAEALETGDNPTLHPGATEAIRQVLARNVPGTFAESLYFTLGHFTSADPQRGYVDLQPGMRLVVSYQVRQSIPPNTGKDPALSGFVGSGQEVADIVAVAASDGSPRMGFDAFSASTQFPPIASSPDAGGGGGLIDLAATAASFRHLRLCLPANPFPNPAGAGTVGPAGNVAILGADDLATLSSATISYYKRGDPGANLVGYLRGRAIPVPHIPFWLQGALTYVPVGTTIRQAVQRIALLPRLPGILADSNVFGQMFQRYVSDLSQPALAQRTWEGFTFGAGAIDGAGADAFDAPLLPGDSFQPNMAT